MKSNRIAGKILALLFVVFGLCVICSVAVQASITMGSSAEGQVLESKYEIYGTVYDPRSDSWWEGYFDKLGAAQTEKDFEQLLRSLHAPASNVPAAGVVVKLRDRSKDKPVEIETITDADGKYKFTDLLAGWYDISCEKTMAATKTGQQRQAFAFGRKGIRFRDGFADIASREVTLRLSDDYVTVTGKVVDGQGNGVADAAVVGISDPVENGGVGQFSDHTRAIRPQQIRGITDADGYYELKGFKAANFVQVFRYLINTKKAVRGEYKFFVDIHAGAEGFVQDANKALLRVPLAGEQQIYHARRLLESHAKMSKRVGNKVFVENKQLEYPFAESKGGVLTVVDIVLDLGVD